MIFAGWARLGRLGIFALTLFAGFPFFLSSLGELFFINGLFNSVTLSRSKQAKKEHFK
ncbi:MAG TPA: hypothetical protein PKI17_00870 [Syntrophomonas sp.]|nr:hypothetical protein [Syntrophomonas sp.]